MKRNRQITNFFACLFLLFCTSCQEIIYHSYQPVKTTGWFKEDTLVYTLDTILYNQNPIKYQLGIRHKDSYKYRDIWLTINQDTVHYFLGDSTGKWLGHGIGELRQLTLPFYPKHSIQDTIREFRITHIMQDAPLKGILDIGISIHQ